jgi:hypothetical protein
MKTSLAFLFCGVLIGAAALRPAASAGAAHHIQTSDGKPAIQDEPRGMARVVYFGNSNIAGEYTIEYGKPAWKAEYDKNFDKQFRGQRVRLGRDYWATLDAWNALTVADKDVKAGAYFLALECSDKGQWSLVLLDPEPLRKQRYDAYGTPQTKGGQLLPLTLAETKDSADTLTIRFIADEKDARLQTLEIRFGKHRLTAPVKPKV